MAARSPITTMKVPTRASMARSAPVLDVLPALRPSNLVFPMGVRCHTHATPARALSSPSMWTKGPQSAGVVSPRSSKEGTLESKGMGSSEWRAVQIGGPDGDMRGGSL
jgi:hypothetical protein